MRWTKVGVINLLLISLLLASSASALDPSTGVWDTILEVGSLGFLKEGNDYSNLISFVRVLLGILIFALLYMGASAVPGLKEQRNIAITVCIILAIITVIFIPPSILVGIGSAYSTLFAVVILGAPIVAIFLLYRKLEDSSIVLKLVLLIILLLILIAVKNTSEGYLSEEQRILLPVLPLIEGLAALVDWGIGIVVFMIIMEIFKAFKGNDTVSEAAGKAGKKIWSYTPGTKSRAKRVTKKEMNEYIMEENQEKNLDEVRNLARTVVADLEILKKGQTSSKGAQDTVVKIKKLGEKIKGARKYFNSLNRRTTRAQTGITRLLNYMKDRGLKDAELVEKVRVFENNVLKLHQQTSDELGKVEAFFAEIMNYKAMSELENGSLVAKPSEKSLDVLIDGFKNMDNILEDAYKRQEEAKKEVVALISLTRNLV